MLTSNGILNITYISCTLVSKQEKDTIFYFRLLTTFFKYFLSTYRGPEEFALDYICIHGQGIFVSI